MAATGQIFNGKTIIYNNTSTVVTKNGAQQSSQTDNHGRSVDSENPADQIDMAPNKDIYKPATPKGKALATKLKGVVALIYDNNNYKGIPLREVYEGYSTDLNEITNLPDKVVTLLTDMKICDEASARRILKTKDTEHVSCCISIYEYLFKNGNVDHLIYFWENTNNSVLIERSEKWLGRKYK